MAIADGKEVQYSLDKGESWDKPTFDLFHPTDKDDGVMWRIKPEPKPDVVKYVGFDSCEANLMSGILRDDITTLWKYWIKIIADGETNEPKSVELIK